MAAEVAHMYPACLIGSWVVAMMGLRTRPGLIGGKVNDDHKGSQAPGADSRGVSHPFHALFSFANSEMAWPRQIASAAMSLSRWPSKLVAWRRILQAILASLFASTMAALLPGMRVTTPASQLPKL